jgi:hypothetical protein
MTTKAERASIWESLHDFADCLTEAKTHFERIVLMLSEIDSRESERNARKGNRKSKTRQAKS